MKFDTRLEYENWIESQEWYQTIPLPSGITTQGKFRTDNREAFFKKYDFRGKRVLDIGCNSGEYCFMAKQLGALEVIGVDIDNRRIEQAKVLSDNEGLDIEFLNMGIEDIRRLGSFDIVICVAVLTEIQNILGVMEHLRNAIGHLGLVELDIAKPFLYVPSIRHLFGLGKSSVPFATARKSKRGWMLSPGMELLEALFGNEFNLTDKGRLVRYRMLEIRKK